MLALGGFAWDSAIAKKRVKQCAVPSGSHLGELQGCQCNLKGFSMSFKRIQSFFKFTKEKVYCIIILDSATAKRRVKQYANFSEDHLGE